MKAVVFYDVGDIRIEEVPDPRIQDSTDAIVRITASAICGTDLHMVRGTKSGMKPGTILGHEGVGIVEEVGPAVRNLKPGDRAVISSIIACGYCFFCRDGYYAQCDNANPNGSNSGPAYFGGPEKSGAFHGLQAEKARIPYANITLFKLPDEVSDDQAIIISDVFPSGYFGAKLAEIDTGSTVAVFGCGPVGLFVIASAKLLGARRVLAIDTIPSRLEMAQAQGAEIIDFNAEDPVEMIRQLTGGIGVDSAVDAVGVDAERPRWGPAAKKAKQREGEFEEEVDEVMPGDKSEKENWDLGDAPSQALVWAVESLSKAGTLSVIGSYPSKAKFFPLGPARNKNIRINMGICNHQKYIPILIDMVRSGTLDPTEILTQVEPITSAVEAYKAFAERRPGWMKVKLEFSD
ncbi:MAG TPA: zinc-dependent alcohol dehydrogenase [Thermodesulfobacteriota bacterium]|nr:zinc-dependent alcohol dehydrogenase [Thermodesulfobacteriota bacterium]